MVSATKDEAKKLTRKDFQTDQEVRWCPGCGDYAILATVQRVMPTLGIPKEKIVVVSGIGCSSRFPYYMNTYGMHGIHGRAPAIATGIKIANPELSVWVATGDGDGLSIGGNHLIHALRRNVGLKILLFNNRIYGLTKGQYSPTSEVGQKTKSTPYGVPDHPFNPIAVALGTDATFVARALDVAPKHLEQVLLRAAQHEGSAFIEIYQNCVVFNDGAFDNITGKEVEDETQIVLEHGKPLLFGKDKSKGIRLAGGNGLVPEVVEIGKNGVTEKDILVYDESDPSGAMAYLLSRFEPPAFPVPIGVFRAVKRPPYERLLGGQIESVRKAQGEGDIMKLFRTGETWKVG